eukprot:Selendium_serpulae@DN4172_c0_g1_i3.p1
MWVRLFQLSRKQAQEFFAEFSADHEFTHGADIDAMKAITDFSQLKDLQLVAPIFESSHFHLGLSRLARRMLVLRLSREKTTLIHTVLFDRLRVHPSELRLYYQNATPGVLSSHRNRKQSVTKPSRVRWEIDAPPFAAPPTDEPSAAAAAGLPAASPKSWIATRRRAINAESLNRRGAVSAQQLPSALCYVVHNNAELSSFVANRSKGSLLAAGYQNASIRLWDLEAVERVRGLLAAARAKHEQQSESAADSGARGAEHGGMLGGGQLGAAHMSLPKGRSLGLAGDLDYDEHCSKDIMALAQHSDAFTRPWLTGHHGAVFALDFSEDDRLIFSGAADSSIRCWSVAERIPLAIYRSHSGCVWSVDCSSLGHFFVSGSSDTTARLWATDRSFAVRLFEGHNSDVDVVKFHSNSSLVVTGSADHTVRLWDIRSAQCCRVFCGHQSPIQNVAVSSNGRLIASSGQDGHDVMLWDIPSSQPMGAIKGHNHRVTGIDFAHDSDVVATGGLDGTVQLWDSKCSLQGANSPAESNVGKSAPGPSPPDSEERLSDGGSVIRRSTKRKGYPGQRRRLMDRDLTLHNLAKWRLNSANVNSLRFTPENLLLVCATSQTTPIS